MSQSTGAPPLPYRARPPQVLQVVGAALVVSAAAAVAAAFDGPAIRSVLLGLAVVAAAFSVRAARARLTTSEETLAASAVGLALAGSHLSGGPAVPAVLAAVFCALAATARSTAVWPLAAWAAGQLAVLRVLDEVPSALRTELYLAVAVVGLLVALFGRPVVGRLVLATTAPWWVAGVAGGSASAWEDSGARPWLSAALMVAAAAGLVLARLREPLDPLLGPPRAVPVVAGGVAGAALTGAFSELGFLSTTLTGTGGVLLAATAAVLLRGWPRGLLLPVALTAGVTAAILCIGQLAGHEQWTQLSLFLLLTALPTVAVAVLRRDDRPVALPTAVGCLAGSVLLALPAGRPTPAGAAVLLTGLYVAATGVGGGLDRSTRRGTAVVAAVVAATAVLLLVVDRDRGALAAVLAVQGTATLGWAWRTGRDVDPAAPHAGSSSGAWRIGAVELVLAAWMAAAVVGLEAVEAYSLPAAAGLLLASGPALTSGPSRAAWGPGLLVAAVPSTVLAITEPDAARAIGVLLVAAACMVAGSRTGVRAPLTVGAGTALVLAGGLAVRALPWPLATALVVGGALLAVGAQRERRPIAGFATLLADLR